MLNFFVSRDNLMLTFLQLQLTKYSQFSAQFFFVFLETKTLSIKLWLFLTNFNLTKWDGSFKRPQHMFWLRNKKNKIITHFIQGIGNKAFVIKAVTAN